MNALVDALKPPSVERPTVIEKIMRLLYLDFVGVSWKVGIVDIVSHRTVEVRSPIVLTIGSPEDPPCVVGVVSRKAHLVTVRLADGSLREIENRDRVPDKAISCRRLRVETRTSRMNRVQVRLAHRP